MSLTNGSQPQTKPRARGARPAKEPRRRKGVVAEEAQLRARVELARALGDRSEERHAATKLAGLLAEADVELDFAVELAFRALASHDDPQLRRSLAAWLEGLGEPGLAASELRKLAAQASGVEEAAILVRIGVLHARAGDTVGAQEALTEAAERDPNDPLPLELLGAVVGADGAADAYVHAARRRAAAGDADGELENLQRGFELDPASPVATTGLIAALGARGRKKTVDEILRRHAAALPPEQATEVHARRRKAALEAGDLGAALEAALDEGLDGVFEGEGADAFDDLLARASAYEPLAVRLEVRAERTNDPARWAALGRLLSGPLAAEARALECFGRAVAARASDPEALHALRALGQKLGDAGWLVEALVRAAMGEGELASRLVAAQALAAIAEERNDVHLSAWTYRTMVSLDPSDERARAALGRLESALTRHDDELAAARAALASAEDRSSALLAFVRLARSRPDLGAELATALLELAGREVQEDAVSVRDEDPLFAEALRVAERVGDFAGIARLARARLAARGPNVRLRGVLVAALRRAGDLAGAAAEARAFAEESATRWTCSVAWITAAAARDDVTRGLALAAVAPACGPTALAALASVGAERLARAGLGDRARRAAELACRADGEHVRGLLVLAETAGSTDGRVGQVALERVAESAGVSAALCARLSEMLDRSGDARASVLWARRRLTLRPGDPEAAQVFVTRAMQAGDAASLAEALGWLVPQPHPSREMAERLAPALEALGALDPSAAAALGRRALDLLGPRHAVLRRAIEQVADAARDAKLRALAMERWIAAGAPARERGPLLLELARTYEDLRDHEAELRAYARAAREGVDLGARAARIEDLRPTRPDAELAWLEAVAELRHAEGALAGAADAFRELGAALWDMADDRPRAVQAWLRGAHCDSVHGYDTLRRDLATFADAQYAVDCLSELVEREADRVRSGIIATQAARAALDVGAHNRALGLAKLALDRDPAHADALETAEAACSALARVPEMSPVYDQVARRARGRFGRRAAHHRAARFFEKGGVPMLALKHAAQAFIAVPSEGTTLGLLERTAARAQRQGVAVRTLEHVAEVARSQHVRATWMLRAAQMTARDLEGTRQKLDLLLKTIAIAPSPGTLAMLAVAAREILSLAPDDAAAVALRLERAGDQLAKNLEGPDGARIALTFVEMAIGLFNDGEWGWRSLERAIGADADVDEYAALLPHAAAFARAESASDALRRVIAEVEKPYSNVGHALLRLIAAVAHALGDGERRAKLLVRAAEKEPDDDRIVVEADEAVSSHDDVALSERFSKRVGAFRRTEALLSLAQTAIDEANAALAVKHLERATEIAAPEQRPAVAARLTDALVAAGRGEDAVLRELARTDMPREERAQRWADLARIREEHGDVAGAADALFQAATEAPSFERWGAVEQVAEKAGREHVRADALRELAAMARADGDGARLRAILKRLARAEGARGSLTASEAAWREVMQLDATDAEADVALEALLVARGSFDDLASHLGERANRLAESTSAEDKDKLRAIRLRRAAILEQRLLRIEDACAELELVLADNPSHPSALRWLADLYERAGEPKKSLPALDRLFAQTTEELEYITLGVRRVRALLAAGEQSRARKAISELSARAPSVIAVSEARVEVARALNDPTELGNALSELARVSVEEPRVRSEMLVEAAQAAARAGLSDVALGRARDAARLAPDVAATQLFARGLEYRLRGVGDKEDAVATIQSLERLDPESKQLEAEDVALRAFLLAEAQDAVGGGGDATLKAALALVGAQPLVAVGLAERAAKRGRHEEAYRFYTAAVYGNLLGLRRPGRVALAAAESAAAHGDAASTERFLNEAAKDPETRHEALRRAAGTTEDASRARSILRGLAGSLAGADRWAVLADLARLLLASENPSERLEGDRTMREAIAQAPGERASELRAELESFRTRPPTSIAPSQSSMPAGRSMTPPQGSGPPEAPRVGAPYPRISDQFPGIPPAPPPLVVTADAELPIPSVRHPPLGSSPPPAMPSEPPAAASEIPTTTAGKVAKARARLINDPSGRSREEAEKLLTEALREGSVEAADLMDQLLRNEPARRSALLKVRRQAVELAPGNLARLAALRDAAKADQNTNYVRAIEHVLRAFDESGQDAVAPPPLTAQSAQPGILTLLTRHSREPGGEAFGVVWDGAPAVFAKSPIAAGLGALERVVPGPTTALSRLYEAALRLLDTPRFALFHKRPNLASPKKGALGTEVPFEGEGGPLKVEVALLSPPAAILEGDVREDSLHLRWVLGQALSCVLAQNALVLGLPLAEARSVWSVILQAFGPPGAVTVDKKDAQLADLLWQTLPPRTQRRLKELLGTAEAAPFELVLERARQSGRRVGMFLTGDFAHAARSVVSDFPQVNAAELGRPGGLERLCRQLPSLADLLRLAVRPEYADARWHLPTPASQRLASGRLPPV